MQSPFVRFCAPVPWVSLALLAGCGSPSPTLAPAAGGAEAANAGADTVAASSGAAGPGSTGATASTGGTDTGVDAAATGGSAGASFALFVVDDFEDGDGVPLISGGWYVYTDQDDGGGSSLTISRDSADEITMTGEGYTVVPGGSSRRGSLRAAARFYTVRASALWRPSAATNK